MPLPWPLNLSMIMRKLACQVWHCTFNPQLVGGREYLLDITREIWPCNSQVRGLSLLGHEQPCEIGPVPTWAVIGRPAVLVQRKRRRGLESSDIALWPSRLLSGNNTLSGS